MKKLYGHDAIHMLPLPNGFLFVARQSEYEDKLVISYKMFSFERGTVSPVTRNVYLQAKFGDNYQFFEKQLKDFINYKCITLPDRRTLTIYPTGETKIFAPTGEIDWQGKLMYKEFGPSDVVCSGKSLWVSFPGGDTIVRYNAKSMREELRIGSKKDDAFSKPCGLWINESRLMVCNSASHFIEQVNTDTYTVNQYAQFEEPIYQYMKINSNEIVLLESGIYRL